MQRDSINRRRFIRIKFPFTIHLYIPEMMAISAYTEDISEGGVKVTIKEELKVSTETELEIYIQQEPINCRGKVIWVKQRDSKFVEDEVFFDTGIEFKNITDSEIESIKHHLKALRSTEGFIE
ncbi:MAG: PilZ domain-containing protein [Candidatus Omnitrophica bacterium]|nr:PilZ domain-containing protein [Candidatus Omnitrophota bacterium]